MTSRNIIKYFAIFSLLILGSCSDDSENEDPNMDPNDMSTDITSSKFPDFSGKFKQVDFFGRAETTLNYIVDPADQDKFNQVSSKDQTEIEPLVKARLIQMHEIFDATYETNYLGLDLDDFSKLMSRNVMQVSFDSKTSYTNFTGRNLKDDVIDIMLSQMFGGTTGDRFNGQDTDGDGVPDLPILVSDNKGDIKVNPTAAFPYLETPYEL